MGKPQTNKELKERIDAFFAFCQNKRIRPGIETLCLSLHITRQTLFTWSHGKNCDPERTEIINSAISGIRAVLEQFGLQGALNPATYIFLAKNWLGYKDTISLEDATPTDTTQKALSKVDIAKQLGLSLEGGIEDFD